MRQPIAVATLNPGETVLYLGSGGGLDVLLSARRVGPAGRAYGLDGSPEMISLARANAAAEGAANAEFLLGSIEDIPLPEAHVDAVISNCVINLSADKPRVLAGAFRVLRPGGRLGVSDVIASGAAVEDERTAAEQRVGCTTGTVTADQYREQLLAAGFTQVTITPAADASGGLFSVIIQATRPAAPPAVLIRPMRSADAAEVLTIYQAGLDTGQASFETAAPPGRRSTRESCRCTATWPPTPPPGRCSAGAPPQRYQAGACTPGSSSTACTSTRPAIAAGSARPC
jgi:ubiquinone/menaquinone biosynthesis C-methylase UbiE